MLNENNFKNFENLVISEAEKERDEALSRLKERLDKETAEYKKQADSRLNEKLNHELGKIESRANERVSERSLDGKKQYLELRESMIKEIFENVSEKLRDFVKTDDYVTVMKDKIESGISDKNGDCTIIVGANDKKLADFVQASGYKLEVSEKSFIGGCKIVDNSSKTLIDMTYASFIKNESESFLEKYFNIG